MSEVQFISVDNGDTFGVIDMTLLEVNIEVDSNDEISSVLVGDVNISGVFDLSGGIIIVLFGVTIDVAISVSSDIVDIEHIMFEETGGIKQYVRFIQTIPFISLYSLRCEHDIFSFIVTVTVSMMLHPKPQLMSMKIFKFDEIYNYNCMQRELMCIHTWD